MRIETKGPSVLAMAAAGAAGTVLGIAAERRRARRRSGRKQLGFLSLLSHELKTPLNVALGYLDLLEMECGPALGEGPSGYLQRCRGSLRELADALENLLTYSGLLSGTLKVVLEPVELSSLCRSAAAHAGRAAEAKGLGLHLDLPADEHWVLSDPPNLMNIIRNLLGNAVKFTDRGAVALALEMEPGGFTIRVADTGAGLSPEHAARVFEPFWQGDRSVTRRHGGAGLGLTVSRRLARALGGDLTVEGRPGRGALFELRLPASAAEPRRSQP